MLLLLAFAFLDSCMIALAAVTTGHSLMPHYDPPDNYDNVLVLNSCLCLFSTKDGADVVAFHIAAEVGERGGWGGRECYF